MEKIKKIWRSVPIRAAFVLTVAVFVLLATFATSKTNSWAMRKLTDISKNYHYNYSQNGDEVIYEIVPPYDDLTIEDKERYNVYHTIYQYSALFWYSLFIILAALLFYRLKLKKPFDLLSEASKKIADNDLDFHIEYSGRDEFAKLCSAFETMRNSVQQNNKTMWRSVEERKRVNSAFAHDMRTPVTVMKGYADMLQNYMPEQKLSREKEIQTVSKIRNHISRLEQYIESMSAIQKLEDLEANPTSVDVSALVSEIKESATIICGENGKHFSIDTVEHTSSVSIDRNVLLQIYENLIANAVRFSKSEIRIELKTDANNICLCVRDDGQGFSNEELTNATKPYYKGENTSADMHFGLGLYICNLLCKKHGGVCTLSNGENGGAVVTATLKNYS